MTSKRVTAIRPRGRSSKKKVRHSKITRQQAKIILDVRQFFEQEKNKGRSIPVRLAIERTCAATNVSHFIVRKLKTENDVDKFPAEATFQRGRATKVPESFKPIIRAVIKDIIVEKKTLPTLNAMWTRLTAGDFDNPILGNENPEWKWSKETLRRFMNNNGFGYCGRKSHYEYTKEKEDIIAMRDDYLEWLEKYESGGFHIFYQDETWVFKNMAPNKIWQATEEFDGMGVGYRVPSGRGDRSIVSHIGSKESGLLEGCLLLFRGTKRKDPDYHSEMNQEVFLKWLGETVFPKLKQRGHKCVVVLDRAKYHTMLTDNTRPPTTQWRKAQLVDAIKRWGGPPDDWPILGWWKKTNAQLLCAAKGLVPPAKYLVQELADTFTENDFVIKVLFLPVAHPELNPIEMVWGAVKRTVASLNMTHNLSEVERLTKQEMVRFDAVRFSYYAMHASKEAQKYREMGTILDGGIALSEEEDDDDFMPVVEGSEESSSQDSLSMSSNSNVD